MFMHHTQQYRVIIAYWLRIRTVAKLGPKGVQAERANISVAIETSTILPTFKREKIALARLSITMQAISSRCAPLSSETSLPSFNFKH